jgi:hypothetical protein
LGERIDFISDSVKDGAKTAIALNLSEFAPTSMGDLCRETGPYSDKILLDEMDGRERPGMIPENRLQLGIIFERMEREGNGVRPLGSIFVSWELIELSAKVKDGLKVFESAIGIEISNADLNKLLAIRKAGWGISPSELQGILRDKKE